MRIFVALTTTGFRNIQLIQSIAFEFLFSFVRCPCLPSTSLNGVIFLIPQSYGLPDDRLLSFSFFFVLFLTLTSYVFEVCNLLHKHKVKVELPFAGLNTHQSSPNICICGSSKNILLPILDD